MSGPALESVKSDTAVTPGGCGGVKCPLVLQLRTAGGGWHLPGQGNWQGWPWGTLKPTAVPPLSPGEAQPRKLHPFPIPPARCYTYSWDQDNFGESGPLLSSQLGPGAALEK